ncbi:hypothetical protein ABKV19_000803 [Rosa sericea]
MSFLERIEFGYLHLRILGNIGNLEWFQVSPETSALRFLPEIQQMAALLASRMRNRTGSSNPYMD